MWRENGGRRLRWRTLELESIRFNGLSLEVFFFTFQVHNKLVSALQRNTKKIQIQELEKKDIHTTRLNQFCQNISQFAVLEMYNRFFFSFFFFWSVDTSSPAHRTPTAPTNIEEWFVPTIRT